MRTLVLLSLLAFASTLAACGKGNSSQVEASSPPIASAAADTDILAIDATSPAIGHQVGSLEPGQGLVSNGSAGYLMFGQYFDLPQGSYRVTVHGAIRSPTSSSATFDVVYDKGTRTAAKQQVSTEQDAAKSVITTLTFKLPQATKGIEVRGLVPPDVQMTIAGYTVTRL